MPNGRKDLSACEETKDVFGQQASVALIYLEVYQRNTYEMHKLLAKINAKHVWLQRKLGNRVVCPTDFE